MRLVVADTSPVHYLVLIGHIDILPALFRKVVMPSVVRAELADMETPSAVRDWAKQMPAWVDVREANAAPVDDPLLKNLDEGEKAAIILAASLKADLLLMDDRAGVRSARKKGFAVMGTLGILDLAADKGILNLAEAFKRLKRTSFYYPPEIIDVLLDRYKRQ